MDRSGMSSSELGPSSCFIVGVTHEWPRLLSALLLLSCRGSLPHPLYVPQATTALKPVVFAPPPGRVETVPKRPPAATAWVDGEWVLRHGRWYWLLGRWVAAPSGATYSPWVVVRATDGRAYYAPSVWHDATGATMSPPEALAFATASGEAVVDPQGDAEVTGRDIKIAPSNAGPAQESPEESP